MITRTFAMVNWHDMIWDAIKLIYPKLIVKWDESLKKKSPNQFLMMAISFLLKVMAISPVFRPKAIRLPISNAPQNQLRIKPKRFYNHSLKTNGQLEQWFHLILVAKIIDLEARFIPIRPMAYQYMSKKAIMPSRIPKPLAVILKSCNDSQIISTK